MLSADLLTTRKAGVKIICMASSYKDNNKVSIKRNGQNISKECFKTKPEAALSIYIPG
jgi:hypothetical protein